MKQIDWNKLIRCCASILVAIIAIIITNHYRGQIYFTLAPLFAILVMAGYHGGRRAAIAVGLLICGYSLYATARVNIIRSLIVIISVVLSVIPFLLWQRFLDNASSILYRLRELDIQLTGLDKRWGTLNETEKLAAMRSTHHLIANLTTLVIGWTQLAREQRDILRDYERTHK